MAERDDGKGGCWKCYGTEEYCYTCGEAEGYCECSDEDRNMGVCDECERPTSSPAAREALAEALRAVPIYDTETGALRETVDLLAPPEDHG